MYKKLLYIFNISFKKDINEIAGVNLLKKIPKCPSNEYYHNFTVVNS
jgi:hypothetical protein